MSVTHAIVLFTAAMLAGAINAVAGGGTLVSFPALLWAGTAPVLASATSTVALVPGSIGGMWGYRRELRASERWVLLLGLPSLAGGAVGAALLLRTPPKTFSAVVPFLILFATCLLMLQEPISRRLQQRPEGATPSRGWVVAAIVFQLFVAVYGGYFGAGIGILMLSALSLLGLPNIHQMNGLKTLFALCINGVAAGWFIVQGTVDWPKALVMLVGSILGGYGGAKGARIIGQRAVRRLVVVIGFVLTAVMLYKQFASWRKTDNTTLKAVAGLHAVRSSSPHFSPPGDVRRLSVAQ